MPDGVKDTYKNRIEIRYIDSYKSMASSIDSLSKNLLLNQFREMRKVFAKDKDFLIRKGVYPYDYMDSFERFNEVEFPPANKF